MTPDLWILAILAVAGVLRVHYERYQDRLSDADERARRNYGRGAL